MTAPAPELGARIRAARLAAGLSRRSLGQRCGVGSDCVWRWEHGHVRDRGGLPYLTQVLGVSVEELAGGSEAS